MLHVNRFIFFLRHGSDKRWFYNDCELRNCSLKGTDHRLFGMLFFDRELNLQNKDTFDIFTITKLISRIDRGEQSFTVKIRKDKLSCVR